MHNPPPQSSHRRAAALSSPPEEPVFPGGPSQGTSRSLRGGQRPRAPPPCVMRLCAEAFPGRVRLLGDHTAPPPVCLSSPTSLPRQSRAEARGAAVSARESPGRHRGPGGGCPSSGGRCPSGPPTAAPPPGGPELADGRLGSRARAEGCGAAWSRTPAPAAEVTAPLGKRVGGARSSGWRWLARRGDGEGLDPSGRDERRALTHSQEPAHPLPLQLPSPQPTESRGGSWSGFRARGIPPLGIVSGALDLGAHGKKL